MIHSKGLLLLKHYKCLISSRGLLIGIICHTLRLKHMVESTMLRWKRKCIINSNRYSKIISMLASLGEVCSSIKTIRKIIIQMIIIRKIIIHQIISIITKIIIIRKIIINKITSLTIITIKVFIKIVLRITNNYRNKCSRNCKSNN